MLVIVFIIRNKSNAVLELDPLPSQVLTMVFADLIESVLRENNI